MQKPAKKPKSAENVCRKLRLKMGYSLQDMADILGIKKATLQGYDEGRRACPVEIISQMQSAYERELKFWSRYKPGGEFDQSVSKEYPHGILSVLEA